ncbi:PRC-barrel domain-containing protein [Tychonema sp. LEGE 07199]|uniref:PRC-barrel domain-containing protein n=1 Tax=unclassified Tychonema TaxID=2642144 RepID=UPI0018807393|nr:MULTISPECIES: PRC-barrel domain-containing protein [unclassified Tychonema]MBE9120318.1 PRC-barrel domain-containing protein [Tychonema sp. LEGE 07199]MBE9131092.1 PRC-barrel domain-containing protein [Tychonema sp. LEGE 07196]
MTSEQICQRSDILGTQVITRDRGKRLGVVSQLWVDIDRREVVAIGLRDNIFAVAGMPRFMFLSNVSEIGDVLLVEDESAIEDDVDVEIYSILINSEVITETGELLGRVRGFRFDPEDGKLVSIIIASLGIPQIPDQVLSTYELGIEEIVSSGPNRLIVFEGSEERLRQLSVGLLERVGLGQAPWEREEDEQGYYPKPVATEYQLGPGVRIPAPEMRSKVAAPALEEVPWDDDSQWNRPPVRQQMRAVVQPQSAIDDYEDYEEDNWGGEDDYEEEEYEQKQYLRPEISRPKQPVVEYEYEDDVEADAWADDEAPKPYNAPRVNIPEKTKTPEYEEEANY